MSETVPAGVGRRTVVPSTASQGAEGQIEVDVLPADPIPRVRLDHDVEIKIAVASALDPLAAFAGNAQLLAVANALGDAHVDAPRYAAQATLRVGLEYA